MGSSHTRSHLGGRRYNVNVITETGHKTRLTGTVPQISPGGLMTKIKQLRIKVKGGRQIKMQTRVRWEKLF